MDGSSHADLTFGARLKLAWRVLFDAPYARSLLAPQKPSAPAPAPAPFQAPAPSPAPVASKPVPPPAPAPAPLPPERVHASGLVLLAALQREGRLIDFLQQDVTGFADEDVAAAARVVHAGCQRVLRQCVDLAPALPDPEGATVSVPAGFDAQRIRLTGNVTGQPPYRGAVRHHGWVARTVKFPEVNPALDPRVIASAEVELP
jgi:hypothetical protein